MNLMGMVDQMYSAAFDSEEGKQLMADNPDMPAIYKRGVRDIILTFHEMSNEHLPPKTVKEILRTMLRETDPVSEPTNAHAH